jgi:pimeloyl-ACP methyl ester carboxylesterase
MNQNLSTFNSVESKTEYMAAYDAILECWPVAYESIELPTRFGTTHILASGPLDASPLLLLPGNYDSSISWFHNIAALSVAHRAYALDTIGDIGKSITSHSPVNRDEFADWLVDVLDCLRITSTDMMGISYGGFLAANFALRQSSRVKHLVLLCPGIPFAPFAFQWLYRGMPMMLFPSRTTVKWFVQGASTQKTQNDQSLKAFITGMISIHPTRPLRPLINDDEWKKLCMSTLLLIGDHEIMYNAKKAISCAKQLIPHIQAELVEDAGHFLISDQAEKVNEVVLKFLQA